MPPSRVTTASPPGTAPSDAQDDIREILRRHGEVDARTGALHLLDQRLVLLRPETIVDLQKQLERTVGLSSKGFLYLAGETTASEGRCLVERLVEGRPEGETEADALTRVADALAVLGWGRFEVTMADPKGRRYLLTLDNSPIAEAYGSSAKPVCHLLAGWLAGIAQSVLGQSLFCEETVCRAQGKAHCEFELRPRPHA